MECKGACKQTKLTVGSILLVECIDSAIDKQYELVMVMTEPRSFYDCHRLAFEALNLLGNANAAPFGGQIVWPFQNVKLL